MTLPWLSDTTHIMWTIRPLLDIISYILSVLKIDFTLCISLLFLWPTLHIALCAFCLPEVSSWIFFLVYGGNMAILFNYLPIQHYHIDSIQSFLLWWTYFENGDYLVVKIWLSKALQHHDSILAIRPQICIFRQFFLRVFGHILEGVAHYCMIDVFSFANDMLYPSIFNSSDTIMSYPLLSINVTGQ